MSADDQRRDEILKRLLKTPPTRHSLGAAKPKPTTRKKSSKVTKPAPGSRKASA